MSTDRLLEVIANKVSLSPNIAEAFRQIDRALFVPEHYHHQGATWTSDPSGALVYEDKALTTQVRNGLASSSSSQPSVMALMLEALDVQSSHRVLEIGTGTGYNAALLTCLVGERGHVVSVEINEELCERAKRNLEIAGCAERVTVVPTDGRKKVVETSAFDRLILTASFRSLESAWIEQLQLTGVLVGNLQGNLFSVLLKLQKDELQHMIGQLLPQSAYFMALHGEEYPTMNAPDWQKYDALAREHIEPDPDLFKALDQQAFLFFLEGQFPHMKRSMRAFGTPEQHEICQVFLADESSAIIHQNGIVEAHGDIWNCIKNAYERYKQLGVVSLADYRLEITMNQNLFASLRTERWSILNEAGE